MTAADVHRLAALLAAFLTLITASSLHAQRVSADPCRNAKTTLEMNDCLQVHIDSAERKLATYLAASRRRYADQPRVVRALEKSQREWLRFRKGHCDAVYEIWAQGTIRGPMAGRCLLEQTLHRTHEVWSTYLTYMDDTPPILPEPHGDD